MTCMGHIQDIERARRTVKPKMHPGPTVRTLIPGFPSHPGLNRIRVKFASRNPDIVACAMNRERFEKKEE